MAADCGLEPSKPCLCVAQRHRISVPADKWPQAVLTLISSILLAGSLRVRLQITRAYNSIIDPARKGCRAVCLLQFSLFFLQCLCLLQRQGGHLVTCTESRPISAEP